MLASITRKSSRKLLTGLLGASSLLVANASIAQTTPASTDTSSENPIGIETVIVTAARRATDLETTSIAVTAFDEKELKNRGLHGLSDLAASAPVVQFQEYNSVPTLAIRGIGQQNVNINGEPGVSANLNGVYLARQQELPSAIYDLSQIEVLRGPQGTLYGRNATGGSVNFITAPATFSPDVSFDLLAGNYGSTRFVGTANDALVDDQLAGRIAVMFDQHLGYVENLNTGKQIGHPIQVGVRPTLLYTPNERFDLTVVGDYYSVTNNPTVLEKAGDNYPEVPGHYYPWPPGVPAPGNTTTQPWKVYADPTTDYRHNWEITEGLSATANYHLDDFTVRSISAVRGYDMRRSSNLDSSDNNRLNQYDGHDHSHQYNQELQLLSADNSPIQWVAGVYYMHELASDDYNQFINVNIGTTDDPTSFPFPYISHARITTNSAAVYGQASIPVFEDFRVIGGLRYSTDWKTSQSNLNGTTADLSNSWSSFTPKFGVEYQVDPDVFLYGNIARGYKAGGFNTETPSQTDPYGPEYVWSYEAGLKANWFNHRLQTNIAAYHMNYSGLQVEQYIGGTSIAEITNAGSARLDGIEGELNVLPTDNLMISLSANYLHSEYVKTDPTFDLIDPLTGLAVDMTGKTLPNAPRFTGDFLIRYTVPLPQWSGSLSLQGDIGWRSSASLYPLDFATETQAGYTTTNARIAFAKEGGWEVALWGKNLFNNAYYDYIVRIAPIGYPTGVLAPPRTFGIEISDHL